MASWDRESVVIPVNGESFKSRVCVHQFVEGVKKGSICWPDRRLFIADGLA